MTAITRIGLAWVAGALAATAGQAQDKAADPPEKQSVITSQDYPRRAIDMHEEGTTKYRLTIGTDGRVTDCKVTESSGFRDLDTLTCRLVKQRSRFKPQLGANGVAAQYTIDSENKWVAPD
jgi:TonB family protein